MHIPTISLLAVDEADLDDLMRVGFCYVRLPGDSLIQQIKTCVQTARDFFQSSIEDKSIWQLKETLNPGERYQGYAMRTQSKNTNAIEQIFFEADSPFGPYIPHAEAVNAIHDTFMNIIVLPLINAIFKRIQLSNQALIDATTNPYCSLVFQSCPPTGEQKSAIRLNAHKDFGLMTVLFFVESGLEVKYQDDWILIPPKDGHVVINVGNALELMTKGHCHSALHRVTNATDNRISMVYFVSPCYQRPVRNYIDNTVIAQTGEMFFKQQFTEYYEVDH